MVINKSLDKSDKTEKGESKVEANYSEDFENSTNNLNKSLSTTIKTSNSSNEVATETPQSPGNKKNDVTIKPQAVKPTTLQVARDTSVVARANRDMLLSDESFSQQSETEQSDVECRVKALKDMLLSDESFSQQSETEQSD